MLANVHVFVRNMACIIYRLPTYMQKVASYLDLLLPDDLCSSPSSDTRDLL